MKQIDTKQLLDDLQKKLEECQNETQVIEARNIFIGKYISPIYDELKLAPISEKKDIGNFVNHFKNEVNTMVDKIIAQIKFQLENKQHKIDYDLNIDNVMLTKGGLTPHSIVINEIMNFFQSLDFQIVEGEEVVPVKYNFDNLNIDVNHPARSMQDSFFIDINTMLRTHCTATTAKVLDNNKNDDIRVVSFGNVYRNDEDDATHSHQFSQVDIVWIRENLNLRNLKWLITRLLQHLFGNKTQARFRLSYFPFTEPSFEVDITCTECHGSGCPLCKQTGWIEILGAGMLHTNVLKAANINVKTGLAAGIGVDRIVMLKYKFKDIRDLYSNDFRILKQFKGIN